jgi:hypothetical protein
MAKHAGQPAKFRTVKDFKKKIDEYFLVSSLKSMTGLALYLGFQDRQSMHDYEKKGEFSFAVKNARARIEQYYEELLPTARNPSGSIFALKNFGWSDRQELEHSGTLTNVIRYPLPRPLGPIDGLESNKQTGTGT